MAVLRDGVKGTWREAMCQRTCRAGWYGGGVLGGRWPDVWLLPRGGATSGERGR